MNRRRSRRGRRTTALAPGRLAIPARRSNRRGQGLERPLFDRQVPFSEELRFLPVPRDEQSSDGRLLAEAGSCVALAEHADREERDVHDHTPEDQALLDFAPDLAPFPVDLHPVERHPVARPSLDAQAPSIQNDVARPLLHREPRVRPRIVEEGASREGDDASDRDTNLVEIDQLDHEPDPDQQEDQPRESRRRSREAPEGRCADLKRQTDRRQPFFPIHARLVSRHPLRPIVAAARG